MGGDTAPPAVPQYRHHHGGCVVDRPSHTRGGTLKRPDSQRDHRCRDMIDVLCPHRRTSNYVLLAKVATALGDRSRRDWESSLAFCVMRAVPPYCNLARFRRVLLDRGLGFPLLPDGSTGVPEP